MGKLTKSDIFGSTKTWEAVSWSPCPKTLRAAWGRTFKRCTAQFMDDEGNGYTFKCKTPAEAYYYSKQASPEQQFITAVARKAEMI